MSEIPEHPAAPPEAPAPPPELHPIKKWFREFVHVFMTVLLFPFRLLVLALAEVLRWPRRYAFMVLASIAAISIVTFIVSAELTSQPTFCRSCHLMRPYVASWAGSKHHDVTCIKCHFPPGINSIIRGKFTALSMVANYFTGIYKRSKPWAEIEDASCLRSGCHETRLLEGKVIFKEGIIFNHTPHLMEQRRGRILRCTSCHSQMVQGTHMTVTEKTCFLCHFKNPTDPKISTCTWCHQPPVKRRPDEQVKYDHTDVLARNVDCKQCHGVMVVGDGSVERERCSACHSEVGKIDQINDLPFIHETHVTKHKVDCGRCHGQLDHRSVSRTENVKPDCASCHPAFHDAQKFMFMGEGARGIEPVRSSMFQAGLNCKACHNQEISVKDFAAAGHTTIAGKASCVPCHDAKYGQFVDLWKKNTTDRLKRMESIVRTAEAGPLAKTSSVRVDNLKADLNYNLDLVRVGLGVHNVEYADKILLGSYTMLKQVLDSIAPGYPMPEFPSYEKGLFTDCLKCHYGIDKAKNPVYGHDFSHKVHADGAKLACTLCHQHKVKHGETIVTKTDCTNCHHTRMTGNCERCHPMQTNMYKGKWPPDKPLPPNPMVAADVKCADCHLRGKDAAFRPTKEGCLACHEAGYDVTMINWRNQTEKLLVQAEGLLTKSHNLKREEYNRLATLLETLKDDGSEGVHNPEGVHKLLEDMIAELKSGSAPTK